MDKKHIVEANIHSAQRKHNDTDFIENDILLSDKLSKNTLATSPRRMTFILIALCTEGEATFTIDTQERVAHKNDVIIISDRHVVDDFQGTDDVKGIAMMLSVNFFYEIVRNVSDISLLFQFSREHPVVTLSDKEVELFKSYYYLLKDKISETTNHFRRDIARTLILAMFYDLSNVIYRVQQASHEKQTRADAIFTKFIKILECNFKQERRVGWYAEQLCITPKYLSETVKAVSKRTPNEWIDNYVTLEARVLLKTSSKSIKEIALELNFPNQSFLGKFFKEHVGMSPSAYRKL